jgi:hypothetical protein
MASLAHGLEVAIGAILGLVVEMRDGQDDNRIGVGMALAMLGDATAAVGKPAMPFALASALRPIKADARTDRLPVLRVAGAIFGADRHGYFLSPW